MKITRFHDVPQFITGGSYMVNVGLKELPRTLARYVLTYGLDLNPDFQRGNVWTETQKIRYIEYLLRGGRSGRAIYINDPSWNYDSLPTCQMVIVDGKQRIDAALAFLSDEFQVFGSYFSEFTDSLRITHCNFEWNVNDLQTREEVLQWYLDMNVGGTVHSDEEIDKVRGLRANKTPYVPSEDKKAAAHFTRPAMAAAVAEIEAEEQVLVERRMAAASAPAPAQEGQKVDIMRTSVTGRNAGIAKPQC